MIEFNSIKLSSKWRLSMLALFGGLALSACQTAPLPSTSATSIPTTRAKETVVIAADSRDDLLIALPQTTAIEIINQKSDPIDNGLIIEETFEQNNATENVTENAIKQTDSYPIEPYSPPHQDSVTPHDSAQFNTTISIPNEIVVKPVYDTQYQQIVEPTIESYDPEYNRPKTNTAAKNANSSSMPAMPSHNDLLERARQNSQQQTQQSSSDNSSLPAFRNLMDVGISQLKSGQLTAAENSFTRAQRMAPKSSAVYFYLAQVALKKGQPRKAEAMARRGLVVSEDSTRRRALWQIILQSGQAQNSTRIVNEAKQALR